MFKAGDVVKMKMGGPLMTINEVEDEYVICVWFDTRHCLHTDEFLIDMLEKVNIVSERY